MPSDSGAAWSPPASNSERRLSNSSDGSGGSGYSKALSSDSADFLATRPHTAAVIPGKPAGNPLQFVKVGPADLGSRAREQLRKAELAKKTEPARVETQEDWQSNLDNWKSSRRKRVEHIIERCVEVRRMENEPSQPRGKSKTFNEMLEERAGRRRRNPLALYTEDDGHDLSDLGIGTSSTKSSLSEDCDTHSLTSDGLDLDKHHSDVDNLSNCENRKVGSSANEYDNCMNTISSPEPEEYTYERAIEGYKTRIIQQTNKCISNNKERSPDKSINGDLNRIRTTVSNKIEEKLSSFQQERDRDMRNNNNVKKNLPKVDIHKRREQFERENSQESQTNKPKLQDIANKTSIKDRMSNLEKFNEESLMHIQKSTSDLNKFPTEVKPLKDRLSSLEKVKTTNNDTEKSKRLSNGDLTSAKSVKERLFNFKSQTSEDEAKIVKTEVKDVSMSIKERLSCLDAAKNKEIPKVSVDPLISTDEDTKIRETINESNLKTSLTGIESQMQCFCRSLDSLDINGQTSPSSFERVQSLEDFDCGEMQHNTPSDLETEDSGIHTARDSCVPPDDIADLTQVASPIGEPMASEYESSNEDSTPSMMPNKIDEPPQIKQVHSIEEIIAEDPEENDHSKAEDTDSASNYVQAVSQQEELSFTSEITEILVDKDDEDTLKSLDNQDTSVSLNESITNSSESDTVVFEGKMTIQLNLDGFNNGAGSSNKETNKSMPMVIDALELAFQELDSEQIDSKSKMADTKEKPSKIDDQAPLYENIDIFLQNGGNDAPFPLDLPAKSLEPPKEKPPPPPVEDDKDELLGNGNFKHTSSARRIKREIHSKRTSFLGIEGQVDDSYLDADLNLAPRPDITSFLQEETKIEKLLYKRTLSHDIGAELRESRDSGVDVDRADVNGGHSRQGSEPYATVSTSDEEDHPKTKPYTDLSAHIRELTADDDDRMENLDKKITEQQVSNGSYDDDVYDDVSTKEVLRFERELLQLEKEELRRQRENLIKESQKVIQKSVQDLSVQSSPEKPTLTQRNRVENHRHSMPNLLNNDNYVPIGTIPLERTYKNEEIMKRTPFVSEEHIQRHFGVEESRKVLYESPKCEQDRAPQRYFGVEENRKALYESPKCEQERAPPRPPQPILPPKPRSRDSLEREITMRSSRVPSAVEYVNVERPPVVMRQRPPINGHHPMSRHTLQALSAAPVPKLMSNSEWLQSKNRKPNSYYNQHWLIQEAEQRRIEEQRAKYNRLSLPPQPPAPAVRTKHSNSEFRPPAVLPVVPPAPLAPPTTDSDKILSVSGRRKCSHCGEELGRGAAMIIESLSLCFHVWCFTCALCGAPLGDGRNGTDVRVRNYKLHCHHCYSGDDGRKYSCV